MRTGARRMRTPRAASGQAAMQKIKGLTRQRQDGEQLTRQTIAHVNQKSNKNLSTGTIFPGDSQMGRMFCRAEDRGAPFTPDSRQSRRTRKPTGISARGSRQISSESANETPAARHRRAGCVQAENWVHDCRTAFLRRSASRLMTGCSSEAR